MSTRSTILYLQEPKANYVTHWFSDCTDDSVTIDVDKTAIQESESDEDGIAITLKGDSILAKVLNDHRVQVAVRQVLKDLGQE
jgi:hypothetical protein